MKTKINRRDPLKTLKCILLLALMPASLASAGIPIVISNLCGTGKDPACTGLQPIGLVDAHWNLATPYPTSPSGQPVPLPSTLTYGPASVNTPNGAWLANGPGTQWITPQVTNSLGGNYVYETTFDIPSGYDPATATISGWWSSDNEGIAVWLNDTLLAGFPLPGPSGFNAMTNFTITHGVAGATFQPGPNKLFFHVRNRGVGGFDSEPTDTGLRVQFTGSAILPIPASIPACLGTWDLVAAIGPSPRQHHAMAYDSTRHVVVLFGGSDSSSYKGDTWEWNGTAWTLKAATGPSPRNETAMVFDSARGVVVLFGGGQDNNPQTNNDTWEWNGTAWTLRTTTGPSARVRHAMAYDSARGVTVLFGGLDASGPGGGLVDKGDTWEWNGTAWTLKATTGPIARESHAMAFDSARGKTVLFGGFNGSRLSDTWEWNGMAWTQVGSTGPSGRSDHGLAYQSDCARTILFGGFGDTGRKNDTWEWNGTQWIQIGSSGPSARNGHKMAYDGNRRRVVLFGGNSVGVNAETWEEVVDAHFGLRHAALGEAILSTDLTTGDLVVANIGSSGQDGVRIDLGESTAAHLTWRFGNAEELPTGAFMRVDYLGSVNGVPAQVIQTMRVEDIGTQLQASFDFPGLGVSNYSMEVRLNGHPVDFVSGITGVGARFSISGCDGGGPPCTSCEPPLGPTLGFASPTAITLTGHGPVVGDAIVITPGIGSPGTTVDYASSVSISAAHIPQVRILDESIRLFGASHKALGIGTLNAQGGHLTVGSLGSSGQDGVSLDLGRALSTDIAWVPLDLNQPNPLGAWLQLDFTGSVSGMANHSLGLARVTHVSNGPNGYSVSADLTAINSPTERLEIYNQGTLLMVFTGQPMGVVAQSSVWPSGGGKTGRNIGGPFILSCISIDYPPLTDLLVNGTHFSADRLLILQEGTPSVNYLSGVSIRAADIPKIDITNEQTVLLPTQPLNLSTRMFVQTGDNVGIGGFIITGAVSKSVLIRAIGPSLTQFGVPNALADPVLELHGPGAFGTITNNNWKDTQQAAIEATGLPPTNDLESAIVATLAPGSYTAVVKGNNNTTGVALVEVYDLAPGPFSKLANISTRALVGTGDNVVIAGFILGNGDNGLDRIVVRGIGPTLIALGIPNALANPTLELRDNNGAVLVANNDWQDNPTQAAALTAAGLAPANNLESGIAVTLPPGLYTALFAGANNGTGVGLVEVYDLGPP